MKWIPHDLFDICVPVTLSARVWIEIMSSPFLMTFTLVTLSARVWIEIFEDVFRHAALYVTLSARVWIEILMYTTKIAP